MRCPTPPSDTLAWWLSLATLAALSLPAFPDEGLASGYFMPGRGVRPMGRAGSFVASGEGNLNSLWYNPANLAGMQSVTFTGDLSLISTFASHQRAPRTRENGETQYYDRVTNKNGPVPDPQLLFGGPIGDSNFVLAGGVYAPYAATMRFPEGGPQRYALVDNTDSVLGYLNLALAWQPTDWFRIGAGVQNMMANFQMVTAISGYSGLYGHPEDRDLDILSKITVKDYFSPTGNIGVWTNPVANLEAAFSLQAPASIRDEAAKLDVRMPSHPSFDHARLSNDTVAGQLDFPLIGRLALRWSEETWDVELAATIEGWSTFDEIEVSPNSVEVENVPGIGALPVGSLAVPQNWENTWSVRLGGHYDFSDSFTARAGYTFETGAVPDDHYSVFAPDADKHVIGLGLTQQWGNLELDVSGAFYALNNKTIAQSDVRQLNPIDTDDELATVVGRGDYQSNHFVVGVGVNYAFE